MKIVSSFAAMGLAMLLAGCDPSGAGATGVISLADGVSTTGFQAIDVCIAPDLGDAGLCAGPEDQTSRAITTFPASYEVGGGIGETHTQTWRATAWLSASPAPAGTGPSAGAPFGQVTFDLKGCPTGFCGTTQGVNIVIGAGIDGGL